jgi:hypothetical protein
MENTEAQTTVEKEQNSTQANPQNVLFGTISYENELAYENFVKDMNVNHAIFILMAAANFSQAKGAFNLLESETLSAAIRTIRKTSGGDQPQMGSSETTEDGTK